MSEGREMTEDAELEIRSRLVALEQAMPELAQIAGLAVVAAIMALTLTLILRKRLP